MNSVIKINKTIESCNNNELLIDWERQIESSDNPYSLYGSPEWFKIVKSILPEKYLLGTIVDENNKISSFVPIELNTKRIFFSIRNFNLLKFNVNCANVMSGEPLGTGSVNDYAIFQDKLIEDNNSIEAIYFKCIQNKSFFNSKIANIKMQANNFIYFFETDNEKFQYIKFESSFDEYLKRNFNKKSRYNLKRQYRLAQEASTGNLKLTSITKSDQIDYFIDKAKFVLDNSWKSKTDESIDLLTKNNRLIFKALSEKGLFRSFILEDDDQPWAFALGYQNNGIYHYANIAYNLNFAHLSPGFVLFYSLLENLFNYDSPKILIFGIGDTLYKKRFGTDSFIYSSLFIFKKKSKHFLKIRMFQFLNYLKSIAKNIITNN